MWRFSYMTAENGGAAFVVLYVAMTLFIGLPVMLAELTVGRSSRRSPIQALVSLRRAPSWKPLGALFVTAGVVILGLLQRDCGLDGSLRLRGPRRRIRPRTRLARFEAIATGITRGALAPRLHGGVTALVVSRGIRSGIERVSLILMPLLALYW